MYHVNIMFITYQRCFVGFLFQYSMNPFYKLNTPIKSLGFEKKAQLYGRKYLSSWT